MVVDNNSGDDSVQEIKKLQSHLDREKSNFKLKIIENSQNSGFAYANNLAIGKSTGRYLLLLNSDTIVQKDALQHLLQTYQELEKKGSAIKVLAAQLLSPDGSIQSQGGSLPNLLTLKTHMLMLAKLPIIGSLFPSIQQTQTNNTDQPIAQRGWIGGTAMFFSKTTYDQVGPLDENIFMYGEDTEYCLRANKLGCKSAISSKAKIIHLGSQSSTSNNALIGELTSLLYIFKKHFPSWQLLPAYLLLMFGCGLRILIFGVIGLDRDRSQAYYQAWRQLKNVYNSQS